VPTPSVDPSPARGSALALTLLALLCVPVFFWGLGRYGIVNADEAIYHGIAERMVSSGDWLHLDFRGEPRFYDSFLNAPLHYFARAILIGVAGSNLWTMRILSALAGAATVLVTASLGARLAGARAGILAGLALLTSFQFVYLHGGRTGELDMLVSLEFVSAAWLFQRALAGRSFLTHHAALCALLWTKAPLVLVPLAVEAGTFVASRAARSRLRAYLVTGLAVLPLAIAWHALQLALWWNRAGPVIATFWDQARGTRTDGDYLGPIGNAFFYLRTLAWGLFPWSAALPFALIAALRDHRLRPWLVWPGALALFFVLVAKHYPWYWLPTFPFLAIALGAWLDSLAEARAWHLALAAAAVVATLACVDASPRNPFAEMALTYPMQARLRAPFGIAGPAALTLVAALAGAAAFAAARLGARARTLAAAALGLALLVGAALRVAGPLAELDTQSDLDRFHAALVAARTGGRRIEYPIHVPQSASVQIARFMFADDYEMELRARPLSGTSLWLHPKGDPAVLDRSIGRLGLEQRLARGGVAPGIEAR
jgi:4-amino-4-deoxy-L-arabinose transferase-like glycosyltransferase